MKILVAYYSLHGHTEKTAKMIARRLWADLESIKDKKKRSHLVNWPIGAFDEELRKPTEIEPTSKNTMDYDLVIIGSPLWDGLVPAVKAYLSKNNFKQVAFFITFHAASEDAAMVMSELSKKKPIAIMEIQDLQINKPEGWKMIKRFCQDIKSKI